MLIVETIARIRREHFIKGKTIKEIAGDLKVCGTRSARETIFVGKGSLYNRRFTQLYSRKPGTVFGMRAARQRQASAS